ncbi:MAG: hypothetical protein HRT35_38535, partial [Algicola sp.]|nr:hypothetical protein [Algicola sp.]
LVTYGKVAGGGLPLGIVAGKKSVMDSVDGGYWSFDDDSHPYAETTVFQGTFCKHPLTMAAAHAVLSRMKQQGPQLQQGVNALTDKLALRVNDFFASQQLPIKLAHFGSVFRFDTFAKLNPLLQPIEMDLFYNLLLEQGIYTWEKRICFLSTKHTEADIDCFVEAIKRVIGQMKAAGFFVEQSLELPALSTTTTSYIASSAQKRLYFLQSLEQEHSPYQLTAAFDVKGQLDRNRFTGALTKVLQQHPILRSTFNITDEGELLLTSTGVKPSAIKQLDGDSKANCIKATQACLDLENGPAFLVHLYSLAEGQTFIVITTHHCVIDGLSWDLFLQDLLNAYQGLALSQTVDYQQFVQWQNDYSLSEACQQSGQYWQQVFDGEIPALELPCDRARPARKTNAGAVCFGQLDANLVTALKDCAKQQKSTLNMLLFAVYDVFLYKLTGQRERVIGLPISGRPEQQFEQVIGMFANTIAIKTQVTASQSFAEHLSQIKTQLLGAYQHQHYPFERLIDSLALDKDFSRNPLFDTLFVFENGQDRCFETDELTLQPYPVQKDSVAYDLVLEMIEQNGRMSVDFEYNSDLLNAGTIKRWQQYFVHLLEQVVAGCAR